MSCKPITMADLIGGQAYISVGMSMDNKLWMDTFTMYDRPFKDRGTWWFYSAPKSDRWFELANGKGFYDNVNSVSDRGLDPSDLYNQCRTFRYTAENLAVLQDLVDRQDTVTYLQFIGVQDPDSLIAEKAVKYEDFMDFCDDLDQCFEDVVDQYYDHE